VPVSGGPGLEPASLRGRLDAGPRYTGHQVWNRQCIDRDLGGLAYPGQGRHRRHHHRPSVPVEARYGKDKGCAKPRGGAAHGLSVRQGTGGATAENCSKVRSEYRCDSFVKLETLRDEATSKS